MADTIRDVVIRVSLDQIDSTISPPDISQAKQVVEDYKSTVKEAVDIGGMARESNADDAIRDIREQFKELRGEAERLSEAVDDVGELGDNVRQMEALQLNAHLLGDSLKQAGSGALQFARGVQLLGVANNEDLRPLLESLAKIQGIMDTFEGAFNVVDGLTTAFEAYSSIQATVAAGNTAVSTTANTAATSLKAMQLALGPIAVAALAASAAYVLFTTNIEKANREKERELLLEGRLKTELQQSRDERRRLQEPDVALADAKKELLELDQKRKNEIKGIADLEEQLTKFNEIRKVQESQTSVTQEERQATLVSIAATEREIQEQLIRDQAKRIELINREKDVRNTILTNERELNRERIRTQRVIEAQKEKELQQVRSTIAETERLLKSEQDRVQTAEEALGRLSTPEFKELERLITAVASGNFRPQQLERLEELGGAAVAPAVSRIFAEQGRERGGLDVLAPLGISGSNVRNLEQTRQTLQQQSDQIQQELDRLGQELKEAQENNFQEIVNVIVGLTEKFDDATSRLKQLENREITR